MSGSGVVDDAAVGASEPFGLFAPQPYATVAAAVSGLPAVPARMGDAVVDVLAATDVFRGKSDARRAVAEGGVYVNNVKVTSDDAVLTADDVLAGRFVLLRRGKKTLVVAEIAD